MNLPLQLRSRDLLSTVNIARRVRRLSQLWVVVRILLHILDIRHFGRHRDLSTAISCWVDWEEKNAEVEVEMSGEQMILGWLRLTAGEVVRRNSYK